MLCYASFCRSTEKGNEIKVKGVFAPLCDRDRRGKEVIFRLGEPSLLNDLRKQKNTINYTVDVKIATKTRIQCRLFSGDFTGNLADPSHILGGQAEV